MNMTKEHDRIMSKLRVLVGCEFSGVVRRAFRKRGHDAWSCDLLPADDGSEHHYQGDVMDVIGLGWDLMIAFPPCTHLAVSGARHFEEKRKDGRQQEAIKFFMALVNAPIPRIAIENPIGIMSTLYRKPDQIIQPWMSGHMEQKSTCLWLKGLPKLVETNNVKDEMMKLPKRERERVHHMSPGPDRWKLRSTTYEGIGEAIADQWGGLS
jgi:hypothetical protein